ncbi:MAG TPA: hypothetical protein VJU61_14300, partial [Polyangiaceae bacterium]|nr:hypothetical protein [Polyangiaceae bacterium]
MSIAFVSLACWEGVAAAAEPLSETAGTQQLCRSGPPATLARAQRQLGQAEVVGAGLLPNPTLVLQDQRSLSGPTERETI